MWDRVYTQIKICQHPMRFFFWETIRIDDMLKFKKDRLLLLKALRELVSEDMENSEINPHLDQEVSEFMIEITDKRRYKRLKSIRKELDKYIEEVTRDQKLMKEEKEFNEKQLVETNRVYAERVNAP